MTRRREIGVGSAWNSKDGQYLFHPDEFPRVLNEWMNGTAPFIETRTLHGDRLVIKRGAIEAMQLFTPEGIAGQRAEDKADKQEDVAEGAD